MKDLRTSVAAIAACIIGNAALAGQWKCTQGTDEYVCYLVERGEMGCWAIVAKRDSAELAKLKEDIETLWECSEDEDGYLCFSHEPDGWVLLTQKKGAELIITSIVKHPPMPHVLPLNDPILGGRHRFTAIGSLQGLSERDFITDVVIPDGVTHIGESAFFRFHALANVILPDSVTHIGDRAFWECGALTNAVIGKGVASIGSLAFARTGLASATIPDGVTHINLQTFSGCGALTNAVIGKGVACIGSSAFARTGLTHITIPDGVTHIGFNAFQYTGLTSVKIPDSVTFIGQHAFAGCTNLADVVIGKGVTKMDSTAFSRCPAITNFVNHSSGKYDGWKGIRSETRKPHLD